MNVCAILQLLRQREATAVVEVSDVDVDAGSMSDELEVAYNHDFSRSHCPLWGGETL
jgi:hypothetical protein